MVTDSIHGWYMPVILVTKIVTEALNQNMYKSWFYKMSSERIGHKLLLCKV